ncbi:MAG TPA: 50S ribosomal protein L9 [Acidimicrobiales bacterium]|jgi:large subunit ribosomal protein L9|nr:50S ribosomal protein L9 [Acidimicrobiales bacterium]
MEIILRADVANVGKRGDILSVADGFARNYLVPRGLAMKASPGAVAQAGAMRRARDQKDATARSAAEDVARRLVPAVIHVAARASSEGKLFGSVTTSDVAEAVLAQTGLELDRRKMHLDESIRELGTHRVLVKLHAEVEFPVTVEVTRA